MAVLLPQCCYLCASADICTGTMSFVSDLKNLSTNNHYGTVMELLFTRRPPRLTLRCCTLFPKRAGSQLLTANETRRAVGAVRALHSWTPCRVESVPVVLLTRLNILQLSVVRIRGECVSVCVWIVCTCSTNSDDVLSVRPAGGMSLVKHSICFLFCYTYRAFCYV